MFSKAKLPEKGKPTGSILSACAFQGKHFRSEHIPAHAQCEVHIPAHAQCEVRISEHAQCKVCIPELVQCEVLVQEGQLENRFLGMLVSKS